MKTTHLEIEQRLNHFKQQCKDAKVKCTPQRVAIFSELIQNTNHPDAETVYRNVRKQIPAISRDTVYRTLWLLKDIGLVNSMGPTREGTRFDGNLEPHHHFVCNCCGYTTDIHSKKLDNLHIEEYIKNIGSAQTLQINIHGICLKCAKHESKKNQ